MKIPLVNLSDFMLISEMIEAGAVDISENHCDPGQTAKRQLISTLVYQRNKAKVMIRNKTENQVQWAKCTEINRIKLK